MTVLHTMEDLLVSQVSELYGAVRQITQALPAMVEAAANERLSETLRFHLRQTEGQLARLEEIFRFLGAQPESRRSLGLAGLFREAGERLKRGGNRALVDAGLITDARRVKHYEIAAYASTIALAEVLGLGSIVRLLTHSLQEETAADEKLSRIARNEVNPDGVLLVSSPQQSES